MKFSIIIPAYKVENFIQRTIQSAINQTYKDIEIIVVDDKGEDKSLQIAKNLALQDNRIKIVENKENLKLYQARFEGLKVATGDYIINLDGDDYLDENLVQKCYEILQDSKNLSGGGEIPDFIIYRLWFQDENKIFRTLNYIHKIGLVDEKEFEKIYFSKDNNYINIINKCIKRTTFLKAFELLQISKKFSCAEDQLLTVALLAVSKNIYLLEMPLYFYCYNDLSLSKNKTPESALQRINDLKFVIQNLEIIKNAKDESYKKFVESFIVNLKFIHIARNVFMYNELTKRYPKFIYKFYYSMQKKILKIKQKILRKEFFSKF